MYGGKVFYFIRSLCFYFFLFWFRNLRYAFFINLNNDRVLHRFLLVDTSVKEDNESDGSKVDGDSR